MISYLKKLIQYFCPDNSKVKTNITKPKQKEASEQFVNKQEKKIHITKKLQGRSHTL